MIKFEELTGTLVLVNPALPAEPAGKGGKIGVIFLADLANDLIVVSFAKHVQANYSAGALLVFKDSDDIYEAYQNNKEMLNESERHNLFNIALIRDVLQSPENTISAMDYALKHDTVRNLSMTSLEDSLGLKQQQQVIGR